ncbi:Zinc finger matrin-type protein 2 [Camellia lanceoleosa]|uniref:Zinc finger matrin-type protein 2 n=1 Tax=Camellia lanceoleosa TaxID=1840588 RepID=A0ACC0ISJ2_9ERIC|nr:Zinc finger matrin-type protein 2 [Camellia lanceoleosa]
MGCYSNSTPKVTGRVLLLSVCECVVKDSANYLDHINGKKRSDPSDLNFSRSGKILDPLPSKQQEEEERKRQRREREREEEREGSRGGKLR